MRRLSAGFATPLILIVIGLIVGIGITFGYFQLKSKPTTQSQQTAASQSTSTPAPVTKSTPTTDETENWRVYTDEQKTFIFKYPPFLTPATILQSDQSGLVSFRIDDKEKLVLSKIANPLNMDLKDFREKVKLTDTEKTYERTSISGYEVLITRLKWPCQSVCKQEEIKNEQVHIDFKGNGFIVGFKINTVDKAGLTSVSDEKWLIQIASTFKFLN